MKAERPYPQIAITPKGEEALTGGHPWVYEGEVTSVTGSPADGDLVDVVSRRGSWLGAGFYNSRSLIRVRLLSRNANDRFDADFWARRVQYAWDYRKTVMAPEDLSCCRIIFGEADHFPGLTVDRFGPVLVAQVLCLGLDRVKDTIFSQLVRVLRADGQDIAGVYERNDAALREKEGMAQGKGWYPLPGEPVPDFTCADITENGIRYTVDFENGQKTGFFLDQKYNRQAVARLARGKTVLDCFTHTGSFALNAARGGAKHVTAVDVSDFAVACARENAARNGLESVVDCVSANVFDLLPRLQKGSTTSSSWIRPPSPKAARPPGGPWPDIRRSTTGPCGCCPGADTWPPARAVTSPPRSCSGKCSATRPTTPGSSCGRSRPGSRPPTIPFSGVWRRPAI